MNNGIDREDLQNALSVLRNGGVIVYPTDTVWGIGCDATSAEAVKKVFEIKQRDDSKALISLVSDLAMLERWVENIPEAAEQLLEAAVNPITIIYDHPVGLTPSLLAADGSAAFRVTSYPFARSLCRALGRPLVSTSANISGGKAPASFAEIPDSIKDRADYVCTTGRLSLGKSTPSSVIKVSDGNIIKIIRP